MFHNITKPSRCADVKICHNSDNTGLTIMADLPGIKKEDIDLNVSSHSLCIAGERKDLLYDCCYELPHEVKAKKSDAKFENGLLTIQVPFKKSLKGDKITIH